MKEVYVDEVMHPWRETRCIVFLDNEQYIYRDAYEKYEVKHFICNIDEDYIEALADIFF